MVLVPLEQMRIQMVLVIPVVMVVLEVMDYQIALQEVLSFMLAEEAALEVVVVLPVLVETVAVVRMGVQSLERMDLEAEAVVVKVAHKVVPVELVL